jgi:hypothetical protein
VNYAQLTAAIQGFAENDFPNTVGSFSSADQIATFVQNAEQKIYNAVQILALRKNVTGFTTGNNKYLEAPPDWLATFSLAVIDSVTGEYEYLLDKDVNFIRQSFPFPAVTGKPQYYALWDENTFFLGPTPDASYEMELHYFYYPESIVTAGTSWLGDNFDNVLLYGALIEAATFMKSEPDVMANYTKQFDTAMILLKQLGEGKNRSDAYRNGQFRVPVR